MPLFLFYLILMFMFMQMYGFGKSEVVDRATLKRRIRDLIIKLSTDQPLYLIFHDYMQDLKYVIFYSIFSTHTRAPADPKLKPPLSSIQIPQF
jgi:hypothetical protein